MLASIYQQTAWIPHGADLTPALPQNVTNGKSTLGTKHFSKVRRGLYNPMGYGTSRKGGLSDFQAIRDDIPITGDTRRYTFTVGYQDVRIPLYWKPNLTIIP